MMHLIAQQQFKQYQIGDLIVDPAEVADILASEHAPYVMQVSGDDSPAAKSETPASVA
jgi:hypothetical protein